MNWRFEGGKEVAKVEFPWRERGKYLLPEAVAVQLAISARPSTVKL